MSEAVIIAAVAPIVQLGVQELLALVNQKLQAEAAQAQLTQQQHKQLMDEYAVTSALVSQISQRYAVNE